MNINFFFFIIGIGLMSVYVFFRPMEIEKEERDEIALLDLKQFTVYALEQGGLQSIMQGSSGERYSNRYEIRDANYTDNSHEYIQNMVSDSALYKGDNVYLEGNVHYQRADGLAFMSEEAYYNQKRGVAKTKGPFTIVQNHDKMQGTGLYYNSNSGKIKAKNVTGIYNTKKENN